MSFWSIGRMVVVFFIGVVFFEVVMIGIGFVLGFVVIVEV